LYIGKNIDKEFFRNVFGVEELDQIDYKHPQILKFENTQSDYVNFVVNTLREHRILSGGSFQRLYIVPNLAGTPQSNPDVTALERQFYAFMYEDRSVTVMSYYDFLTHLYRTAMKPN